MDEIISKLREIARSIDVETANLDALLVKSSLLTILGVLPENEDIKRSWLLTTAIFHSGYSKTSSEIVAMLRESMR